VIPKFALPDAGDVKRPVLQQRQIAHEAGEELPYKSVVNMIGQMAKKNTSFSVNGVNSVGSPLRFAQFCVVVPGSGEKTEPRLAAHDQTLEQKIESDPDSKVVVCTLVVSSKPIDQFFNGLITNYRALAVTNGFVMVHDLIHEESYPELRGIHDSVGAEAGYFITILPDEPEFDSVRGHSYHLAYWVALTDTPCDFVLSGAVAVEGGKRHTALSLQPVGLAKFKAEKLLQQGSRAAIAFHNQDRFMDLDVPSVAELYAERSLGTNVIHLQSLSDVPLLFILTEWRIKASQTESGREALRSKEGELAEGVRRGIERAATQARAGPAKLREQALTAAGGLMLAGGKPKSAAQEDWEYTATNPELAADLDKAGITFVELIQMINEGQFRESDENETKAFLTKVKNLKLAMNEEMFAPPTIANLLSQLVKRLIKRTKGGLKKKKSAKKAGAPPRLQGVRAQLFGI
jgi:hypothetical protein